MWFENGINNPECDFHDLQNIAINNAKDGDIFVEVGSFIGESIHCLIDKARAKNLNLKIFSVDNFDLHFMNRENTESFDLPIEVKFEQEREKRLMSFGHKGILVEFFNKLREADKEKYLTGVFVGKSWDAASAFGDKSVFFCFIDAGHSYEAVKLDLEAWYPKMREDGIFCGHDWYSGEGVRKAVIEFAQKHNKKIYTFQSGWGLV